MSIIKKKESDTVFHWDLYFKSQGWKSNTITKRCCSPPGCRYPRWGTRPCRWRWDASPGQWRSGAARTPPEELPGGSPCSRRRWRRTCWLVWRAGCWGRRWVRTGSSQRTQCLDLDLTQATSLCLVDRHLVCWGGWDSRPQWCSQVPWRPSLQSR